VPTRKSEPEIHCANCGHLENEHGTSGTRPCLAMKGDLLHREFCACGQFRARMTKAA